MVDFFNTLFSLLYDNIASFPCIYIYVCVYLRISCLLSQPTVGFPVVYSDRFFIVFFLGETICSSEKSVGLDPKFLSHGNRAAARRSPLICQTDHFHQQQPPWKERWRQVFPIDADARAGRHASGCLPWEEARVAAVSDHRGGCRLRFSVREAAHHLCWPHGLREMPALHRGLHHEQRPSFVW